jgi:hypothetical protein
MTMRLQIVLTHVIHMSCMEGILTVQIVRKLYPYIAQCCLLH